MKIKGKKVPGRDDKVVYGPLVLQRAVEGEEPMLIPIYTQPVWDLKEFDDVYPLPKPDENEVIFTKNGRQPDYDNPGYRDRLKLHGRRRWGYLTLKSLQPSEIEFDGVSLDDPETWENVEEAMNQEFSHYEFAKVMSLIDEANALNAEKLEVNRETFLSQSKASQKVSTTPNTGEAGNSP